MKNKYTVVVAPATFGYGPASQAVSIANSLRKHSNIRLWAVADGPCVSYLESCNVFDVIFEAEVDELPSDPEFKPGPQSVIVTVTDFERAISAKKQGFTVIAVDALYWMWQKDPIDVKSVDAYLCLTFPGVASRIAQIQPPSITLKEIPQISEPKSTELISTRNGFILNFGGGTTPFGLSYDYAAALVKVVQAALIDTEKGQLLITCSDAAKSELRALGIQADIKSLSLNEMLSELRSRSVLITLPGLSIMWDAVMNRIPTFVVPGISYSQHQLVREYIRFFEGMSFFTWDDLLGYGLLPLGMDEGEGVRAATKIADRFAKDNESTQTLTRWLSEGFLRKPQSPSLRKNHPWGDFSGADKVTEEVLHFLFRDL